MGESPARIGGKFMLYNHLVAVSKTNLVQQLKLSNLDLKNAEIEGILHLISTAEGISSAELIRKTGLPKETLRELKVSLARYLAPNSADEIVLTNEAAAQFKNFDFRPYRWSISGFSPEKEMLSGKIRKIREKYSFQTKREYDQFLATPETTAAKALAVEAKIGAEGSRIALLGDDDLVSVALSLLENPPVEIVVFDIDTELLTLIKEINKDLGNEIIQTVNYDVKNNLDAKFLEYFDAVLMDPPYTRAGVSLFLSRGIRLLKKQNDFSGSYIFMNFGGSFKSPEKFLKIQETINNYGLLIEDKFGKYNRYIGGESIGSSSSLYILKTTSATTPIEDYLNSRIYTYEDMKEENFPFVEHFTFKIYGVPARILNSKKTLQKIAGEVCNIHKFKVMGTDITKFNPFGYSITVILANSNLLIHTWPENAAVHIDLLTCSPVYKKEKLSDTLMDLFNASGIEVKKIE